jgi:hypothetical protein
MRALTNPRAILGSPMSNDAVIEATGDEIDLLSGHLLANPLDGPIRLSVDEETGSLVAEWISHGNPTKIGPAVTKPLP